MPRKNATPNLEPPDYVVGEDTTIEAEETDSGVNQPPYDAKWISIKAAAQLAGVTGQSVRNAYENHEAFNPTVNGNDESVEMHPAWFRTKMIDSFGNPTDYDVVYVDADAVRHWIEARSSKPSTHGGAHGNGPKRHIVRLTDEQVAAQPTMTLADGSIVPAVELVDGSLVALEKPPQARRKSASTSDQPEASDQADEPLPEGVAQTDLFDVDLIEDDSDRLAALSSDPGDA